MNKARTKMRIDCQQTADFFEKLMSVCRAMIPNEVPGARIAVRSLDLAGRHACSIEFRCAGGSHWEPNALNGGATA
jgi:hypothetical protein